MEAFEQLFGLGRGEFGQKFSKNSNARGLPGGMLKLRFDWYITVKRRFKFLQDDDDYKAKVTQTSCERNFGRFASESFR